MLDVHDRPFNLSFYYRQMGDKATLSKAIMELEDMYQGIPDESVNLTFQDFAELKIHQVTSEKKKKPTPLILDPISELKSTPQASSPSPFTKLPSLDFNRALQASRDNHRHHHNRHHINENNVPVGPYGIGDNNDHNYHQHGHAARGGHGRYMGGGDHHSHQMHHGHDGHAANNDHHMNMRSPGPTCNSGMKHGLETSLGAFDHDVSGVSGVSMASMYQKERGGIRRPGIPHSNICTICSTYIYIFRHRCLVCGRVYCRRCVMVGMAEMTEGRKCVECLGRRFSQRAPWENQGLLCGQESFHGGICNRFSCFGGGAVNCSRYGDSVDGRKRYIQRAGKVGCCSRYPSSVKQAELKWAEKGPRRSAGNGGYGRSSMTLPRSKSPMTPMTPRTPNRGHASGPNSFVVNYSPSHRHHLPF
ncbi:hypothetical protein DVH24_038344 [Malus domestica]|uniref:Uncharacterized protein n=1 Tax=Malus domestica TaxID=3750 RepID=A0A498K754_MALDO|nr:hypothetical protein DVH24_038344 [Malus domestica]